MQVFFKKKLLFFLNLFLLFTDYIYISSYYPENTYIFLLSYTVFLHFHPIHR